MTEGPFCDNDDHPRRTPAVARVTWPNGRFLPMLACKGCVQFAITGYLYGREGERHPVQLEPLP